jgi:two-component system, cell cycle response regulator
MIFLVGMLTETEVTQGTHMADNTRALTSFHILPIGFTNQEKATIETFFALACSRAPHWALTASASEARVVLFNATSQQDVDAFKSLVAPWQRVVIVGASDYGTGWAVMPRPLKLTAILTVLNELVKTAATVAEPTPKLVAVAPVPFSAETFKIQPDVPFIEASKPVIGAPPPRLEPILSKPVPAPVTVALNQAPSFSAPVAEVDIMVSEPHKKANDVLGRVLVVDDSDIALKYMQNRLRYMGYESELAKSGEEALALVGKHRFQFVFLDVMMQGMDGYKTCRAIKNNKARQGPPPVVVMLTSRGGTIDKIRGAMAGCDAYLTKPLNEKQLSSVLAKHDESTVLQRWEAVHPYEPLVDKFAPKMK